MYALSAQVTRQLDGMLSKYKVGVCNIFLQHTSASLTINEVSRNSSPSCSRSCAESYRSMRCSCDVWWWQAHHCWTVRADLLLLWCQNADPDVRHDMETFLNYVVPEVRMACL